jgi:hypothetical protein
VPGDMPMPQTEELKISDALRRFDQLSTLNENQLDQVADQVKLRRAARGTCLLDIGGRDPRLLFLIDGVVELVANDGAKTRGAPRRSRSAWPHLASAPVALSRQCGHRGPLPLGRPGR